MPLPTNRADGTIIRAAHVNDIATSVNDLVTRVDTFPVTAGSLLVVATVATVAALPPTADVGDVYVAADTGNGHQWTGFVWRDFGVFRGPQGPISAGSGLLSARPTATAVPAGNTWWATDEKVFYSKSGSIGGGSWQAVTPGFDNLEVVKPLVNGAPVTVAAIDTPYELVEMRSSTHTYDGREVHVRLSGLTVSVSVTVPAAKTTQFRIEYNRNGGGTWSVARTVNETELIDATPFALGWLAICPDITATLAAVGGQTLSSGDTFQVRVTTTRDGGSSRAVAPLASAAIGAFPVLHLWRAG